MEPKTKWEAVKDHVTRSITDDSDSQLEANLENADPELCICLLQVGLRPPAGHCGKGALDTSMGF